MISSVFRLSSNFQAFPMRFSFILNTKDTKYTKKNQKLGAPLYTSWLQIVQISTRVGNSSSDGRCCGCGRAAKIDLGLWTAHPPDKVSVHGREGAFARAKQSAMTTNTGATTHHTDRAAGIVEDLNQSIFHGFVVNLHTGRCDDGACERAHLLTFEDLRSDLEVFITPIGASADKDFIDGQARHLFKG